MVVRHGQKIGLSVRKPVLRRRALALRAMPVAAGIIGDRRVIAGVAAHDMASERRRAAGPDRRHDFALAEAQMPTMAIDEVIAMCVENIHDLQGGPRHDRRGSLWRWRRR